MGDWVKVTKYGKKPNECEHVLCMGKYGGIYLATYSKGNFIADSYTQRKAYYWLRIPAVGR